MRRLEIRSAALRTALILESRACARSRFLHRIHCVRLVEIGCSCYQVAGYFGTHPRTIERWVHSFRREGLDGLKDKPHPGRRARLGRTQLDDLDLALRDAGAAGCAWTGTVLRTEIEFRFGVALSPRHCQRLLRALRQSDHRFDESPEIASGCHAATFPTPVASCDATVPAVSKRV